MKNWFNNLPEKNKQLLAYLPLGLGIVFCLIGLFSNYFLIPGIICLIPAIVFISWYEQSKKDKTQPTKNDSDAVKPATKEDLEVSHKIKETKTPYKYSPPDGYEIADWTFTTTKVRGCQYYIDENTEIFEDDDVEIIHEPTEEYPEILLCISMMNKSEHSSKIWPLIGIKNLVRNIDLKEKLLSMKKMKITHNLSLKLKDLF